MYLFSVNQFYNVNWLGEELQALIAVLVNIKAPTHRLKVSNASSHAAARIIREDARHTNI